MPVSAGDLSASAEEQIFDERARLYARVEESLPSGESRCLACSLGERRWLFPESQVRLLLPDLPVTGLPAAASWNGWPCVGLVYHALATYPVLSWVTLTGGRGPAFDGEVALLLLRDSPVVLRLPGPLEMTGAALLEAQPDDHPWSAGRLPGGAAVARLDRFLGGSA